MSYTPNKVPAYTDISHFRAPYKNANIAGFGGKIMYVANPYGAVETPPEPPPPPQGNIEIDGRGYHFVASSLRETLMRALENYGAMPLLGPTMTAIVPYSAEELNNAKTDEVAGKKLKKWSAKTWIDEQVKANGVVFSTTTTLDHIMIRLSGQFVSSDGEGLSALPVGSQNTKQVAKSDDSVIIAGDPDLPPPPQEKQTNPFVETDERGYHFVASSLRETLMKTLENYGAVFMSPTRVAVVPYTVEELNIAKTDEAAGKQLKERSAKTWIDKQIKASGVVFSTTATLTGILTGQPLPPGGNELGSFPAGSQDAKQAAKVDYGVIIAGDPDKAESASMLAIGLVAIAVVGGGYLLLRKKPGRIGKRPAMRMAM